MELKKVEARFKFVDLFSGLGGFHQAAVKHGGKCVFASEINDELRRLYLKNFGHIAKGDIRNVPLEEVPEHDILFAGFPCQPFSKAGKQLGWEDAVRGTLFENIVEIARRRSPKVLVMENVAHFVRHDAGQTYEKVQTALRSIGYQISYKQMSPHQFSIPHIRQRIYMVAAKRSLDSFVWPEFDLAPELDIASVLDSNPKDAVNISTRVRECIDAWQEFLDLIPKGAKLPSFPIWSMEAGATYPVSRQNLSSFSAKTLSSFKGSFASDLSGLDKASQMALIPPYARGKGEIFPSWKRIFIRQNREFFEEHRGRLAKWLPKIQRFPPSLQKFEWNCQGEERNLQKLIIQFRASGVRVKRRTTSPSLVAMTTTQVPIIPWEGRYMTNRECARLQSMGDLEHIPEGIAGMEAFGNAVNVTVVHRVLKSILESGLLDS